MRQHVILEVLEGREGARTYPSTGAKSMILYFEIFLTL